MRRGGLRRKTRTKLSKPRSSRGKVSLSNFLADFPVDARVVLLAEPAIQRGMYRPKFYGLTGRVVGRSGSCYHVEISDQGKLKTLVVHPVHLRGAV